MLYIQSDTPDSPPDVLTDVLHATRLEAKIINRSEFIAPWGMQMSSQRGSSFTYVEQGECWLRSPTLPKPMHLTPGDLVVLPNSPLHEVVDSVNSPAMPVREIIKRRNAAGQISLAEIGNPIGRSTTLVFGDFVFDQGGTHPLFSLLPPLIYVRGSNGQGIEWLMTSIRGLSEEIANYRPGRETIISRLTEIMFIMILRYWIDHHADDEAGWLSALYDPRISMGLGLLHQNPQLSWTVEKLASRVSMSRSAFAARFTELVGESPLKYLTRWRMQLAMNWLLEDESTIEEIAQRAGYSSVYAFSKTFKRWVGSTPGEYRKSRQPS